MFTIKTTHPQNTDLQLLIAELDAFQSVLYPAESNHCLDLTTVEDGVLHCLMVTDAADHPVGCGAILLQGDGGAELKRIYVRPTWRGHQLGEAIVQHLETVAVQQGCEVARLETGNQQQAAIRLYEKMGYRQCAAFPPYLPDPLSVFMMKPLLAMPET
ncbi:GNAT family N-acetyltransferase [Pantoea cypripedii]|uniref:GNAT family N-acetyltransferase n=1 Tax=Pantoea cypripedii TaxID=55209 RepID=A0A1X1EUD3_PANCY|nr:GNAT family N-acetyltransferase [Pantoea cypripedii]MBP2197765.1 putative acetyltransferase [Pantoea cypripedii]ORM93640.1 GNAT family N-acetyltransferase [Pantoea cypripedii]